MRPGQPAAAPLNPAALNVEITPCPPSPAPAASAPPLPAGMNLGCETKRDRSQSLTPTNRVSMVRALRNPSPSTNASERSDSGSDVEDEELMPYMEAERRTPADLRRERRARAQSQG